jgi:thiol-disulfide isomerase/thioredoxin
VKTNTLLKVLLVVTLLFSCRKAPEVKQAPATTAGVAMPPYKAKTLDGGPFDIAAERGNVIFLNLWATWCAPCRAELPELVKLHNQYASRRFKVIGVSLDEGDVPAVKTFVKDQGVTYPIVLDPDGRIAALFETSVLPTSAIIDRQGRIVWKHMGVVSGSDAEMMRALESALK